jgi:hypothetical protein
MMTRRKRNRLVVELDSPANATDEDLLWAVGRLTERLDDLYRARDGHGVQLVTVEIYQEAEPEDHS